MEKKGGKFSVIEPQPLGAFVRVHSLYTCGQKDPCVIGKFGKVVCYERQRHLTSSKGKQMVGVEILCLNFYGHNLHGFLETGHGYWFYPEELTLLSESVPA